MHELRLLALFFLAGLVSVELRGTNSYALLLQLVILPIGILALLELSWQLYQRRWWQMAMVWLFFTAAYGWLGMLQMCSYSVACDSPPSMNYLAKLWPPYAVIGAIVFGVVLATVALFRWRGVRSRWPAFVVGAIALIATRYFAEQVEIGRAHV